jgi:uncharacterized protein YjcR
LEDARDAQKAAAAKASERGASAVASGDHQRAIQAYEELAAVTPMDAAAQEQMSMEKAIIAARESMAVSTPAGRNAIDVSTPSEVMSSYSDTLASYGINYGKHAISSCFGSHHLCCACSRFI